MGHFHPYVVRRKAMHRCTRLGFFQQHRQGLSDMFLVESLGFQIRQLQQTLAAAMLFFWRHNVIYLQRLRTRPFRIAEHMQLCDIQSFYKAICLLEIFFRFATCPHNDIHTDKGIGHYLLDFMHFGSKQSCIIPTTHQLQHLIRTRLQRDMEMRHKPLGM